MAILSGTTDDDIIKWGWSVNTSVTWAGLTPADIVTPTEFAASQLLWFV